MKPEKYLAELAKTNHDGVTSRIVFDERGDLKSGAITLYQVRNGKWEVAEMLSGAAAESTPAAQAATSAADERG